MSGNSAALTTQKVYLMTYYCEDSKQTLVSHGVNSQTLEGVCLPPEPVGHFRPSRDANGLYITLPQSDH